MSFFPTRVSIVLCIYWLLQCCLGYTSALTIVNGTLASPQVFISVPWSKYIGNFTAEECFNVVAEMVYVQREEDICESLNSTKYQGRIAFIEEFYGSKNSNFRGCAYEVRYRNFVNAGAVGIVSWYYGNPGKFREVFSSGFELNSGKIPLLSVGFDFTDIANNIVENPTMKLTVQLSCEDDEYWAYWNDIKMVFLVTIGSVTLGWGIKAMVAARTMRKQVKTSGTVMPATILLLEGLILFIVGGSMVLTIVGDATPSLYGYGRIGAQGRNFMYFGYTGASFWTSILVAMYWQELRQALSSFEISRPVRNVFVTRKGATIVIVSFVLFALSEIVTVYLLSYEYLRIPGPAITGIVAVLNAIVSVFFIYQAQNLKRFLNDTVKQLTVHNSNQTDDTGSGLAIGLKERTKRLAFWMQVYSAFNLLQIAFVVPMNAFVNTRTGPGNLSFLTLVILTRNGASIAKIEGLIPTKNQSKSKPEESNHLATSIGSGVSEGV